MKKKSIQYQILNYDRIFLCNHLAIKHDLILKNLTKTVKWFEIFTNTFPIIILFINGETSNYKIKLCRKVDI